MIITSTRAKVALSANVTSDQPNIESDFVLGSNSRSLSLGAEKAYSFRATLPAGESFDFAPATGIASPLWPEGLIRVTGSLTSDGTTPVVFDDLIYSGEFLGRPQYLSATGNLKWYGVNWVLRNQTHDREWLSHGENYDAMSPHLAQTWVAPPYANYGQTGTPIVSKVGSIYEISKRDGTDFDGNPLGVINPLAMLIETTDEIEIYFNQGETTPTFSLSENGVLLQCFTSIPTQVTISSPTGSVVNVTIIGNQISLG